MLGILVTTGRLLRDHWPALLAWCLVGIVGRYAAIQVAGFVGATSDIGGALLLPLAPLIQLVSYVAMLLVLRDGLRHLGAIAPRSEDRAERFASFVRALRDGIVPFVALYTAYSYLDEDRRSFALRALERRSEVDVVALVGGDGEAIGGAPQHDFVIGTVLISPVSVIIVVLAFALRWALGREKVKSNPWISPFTAYLEALWVVLTLMMLLEAANIFSTWASSRVAWAWFIDVRTWLGAVFAPAIWVWDGVAWLIGQIGQIVLLPLAWLAVVGAIYRIALEADMPDLTEGRFTRVRSHSVVRRVEKSLRSRLEPTAYAVRLMWRAGPALIGGFVLLFAIVRLLDPLLTFALTRMIGPHDFDTFWFAIGNALFLIPALLLQPLLIALLAGTYDATLVKLVPQQPSAPAPAPADVPAGPELTAR
ncbi:hypothetical protein [Microbacterium stercoris]|uniref:Uncharacterized protein n=1 Tax=Microbacterium stercoris TaxID=2820289 RepID=A0A939QGP1_9MICO|nr:hypothetical protein [Microbacterium stercoris]MBO3662614.1 hypothetical protein [Microbacterium stercoris]